MQRIYVTPKVVIWIKVSTQHFQCLSIDMEVSVAFIQMYCFRKPRGFGQRRDAPNLYSLSLAVEDDDNASHTLRIHATE